VGQVKGGRWKVAGRIKRVGYLISRFEIVESKEWIFLLAVYASCLDIFLDWAT
jgi:hypothetical protein